MQRLIRPRLCWALSLLMVLTPVLPQIKIAAQEPESKQKEISREELHKQVALSFDLIEELGKSVPRETFDPQAIVDLCDRDPEKIFTWVRDHTYLVPYQGLLRGHSGVLMDRRGNSLDRALLLAELFRLSGQEVRLAHAVLEEKEVVEILKGVRPFPADGVDIDSSVSRDQMIADLRRFESIPGVNHRQLLEIVDSQKLQHQKMAETTVQRVVEQTPQLAALVKDARKPVAKDARRKRFAEDIRQHWWVQWKKSDDWVDCDPTLRDASIGSALAKSQKTVSISKEKPTLADAIDSQLKHTLDVRVVVERWDGGQLVEAAVFKETLEPHQITGEPLLITHVPLDWPLDNKWVDKEDPIDSFKKQIAGQWEWCPILLVGTEMNVQSSFTIAGNINPDPMVMFKPLGEATKATDALAEALDNKVVDQLRSKRKRPGADVLTAEWIEYESRTPGRTPRTVRRPVFDLIGPAVRAEGKEIDRPKLTEHQALQRGLAVIGQTEILPLSHNLSADFFRHLLSDRVLANRETVLDAWNPKPKSKASLVMPSPGLLYEFALARQHWNLHRHTVYIDKLNLLSYRSVVVVDEKGDLRGGAGFDILANNVAMHPLADLDTFRFQLQQGVMDTVLEATLLQNRGDVSNTSTLFERTGANADQWTSISDVGDTSFQSLKLSPNVRERIAQDLADGYVVVVHESDRRNENTDVGWWRVDPVTGNTLGMMRSSRGEGYLEYGIITLTIMLCALASFFSAINQVKQIANGGADNRFDCQQRPRDDYLSEFVNSHFH